jgi:hypothetical protein
MHAGTEKPLFCQFLDCKHSAGSGFTRKENLTEHTRSVHRRTDTSYELEHRVIARFDIQNEATEVHLTSKLSHGRTTDLHDGEPATVKRRQRSDAGVAEEGDAVDLRAEIKCLRKELENEETRLDRLEQAVRALHQSTQR